MNDLFIRRPGEKRFVVIDGNHLIHRAFYAIQAPLKTSSGEQTNALYGFASMLLNILELEKPDYIALTFDERAPTFRHEAHEDYKATRVKAPDELYAQIPRIREMVKSFKIPLFAKEGFEADDMMGTLTEKAKEHGWTTYVITGDMDALQLVGGNTYVVFPHKGYREPILFDNKAVEKKYGVSPGQIVDYKALVGDTSDNIKGVDGIGPKRAVELLHKYKTLDGIYEHLNEIPEVMRQKLEAGREAAYFCQKLARIVRDVPCDFQEQEASFHNLDFLGFGRFLEKMEITSLLKRLKKITPESKAVPEEQMSLF
ncbi:hypothetical protein JXA05_03160 [Candidatus Peregrinibacteria bacterium]|nr:hypothetical protein [Candidatus Peregrinibacteria bacterium]